MSDLTRRNLFKAGGVLLAASAIGSNVAFANEGKSKPSILYNGDKKKILITGCGTGFGRDVAMLLAERGHTVIATVQLPAQVTQLRQLAKEKNVNLQVEKVDILDERDQNMASKFDIDVLLNNAGIAEAGAVAEMPMDIFRSQFETNVFSNLALTQKVIKQMVNKKKKGKIIFVSSVAGLIGGDFTGAYCASKHAIESIAEALYNELKPFDIKIATINPGPYLTGFNDRMMESFKNWYDPDKNFIDHSKLKFPFEQFDPSEMVNKMVEVIEQDNGKFRNLLPEEFITIVKETQEKAWDKMY